MNKTHSSRRALRFDAADRETAGWMFGLIQGLDQRAKQPNLDRWANDVRLMRQQDGRTDAEIRTTFQWANQHSFWQSNILSPAKLREKFLQVTLKMKSETNGNGKPRTSTTGVGQRHPDDCHTENGKL
jgi:hypothetical protein